MQRSIVSRRNVSLLALALLVAGRATAYERQVQDLAGELAARLAAEQARTVAVVDFTDLRGDVNELGRFLAEELSISLTEAAAGRFRVIDRTRLAVVFAEHRLGASGLIAPEEAKRLGQLVGADVLVSATMTPFGESVRLSIKALDTETATLRASARGDVPRTGAIEDLLGRAMGERRTGAGGGATLSERSAKVDPVTAKGFLLELQGCRLSGTTAECLVLVENQTSDRVLTLWEWSRLFDDLGNEHSPSLLRIANQTESMRYRHDEERIDKTVLRGVPTPLALTFEGISGQASRVALLSLAARADDLDFSTQFRDFPFSSGLP